MSLADQEDDAYYEATEQGRPSYARFHKFIQIVAFACLIGLVIENTFTQPYIAFHFGFPDRSLKEVCDELYKISYQNEDMKCQFPYPLWGPPEPSNYPDKSGVFGPVTPPRPAYHVPGFRDDLPHPDQPKPTVPPGRDSVVP
jgi:hypothetical protein